MHHHTINDDSRRVDATVVLHRHQVRHDDEQLPPPVVGAENVEGPLDLRISKKADRRLWERRSSVPGRRPQDLKDLQRQYAQSTIAVIGALTSLISAGFALFQPPITRRVSELCGDGLGGQQIVHRGLSWLWIPAAVGMVLAVFVPQHKKQPALAILCVGLVIGMAVGAWLRVETVVAGLCLA